MINPGDDLVEVVEHRIDQWRVGCVTDPQAAAPVARFADHSGQAVDRLTIPDGGDRRGARAECLGRGTFRLHRESAPRPDGPRI
jgi:hypothetical protein